MAKLFRNKYRTETTRHRNWDYGWNAAYYVTICTKNRKCFLGNISHSSMHYSPIGKIASEFWIEIPKHYPFVKLGEFIIMPNHIHGIIIIDKPDDGRYKIYTTEATQNFAALTTSTKNKFGPQSKNLPAILRGYKSAVKKYATMNKIDFIWQPRYHDHIIRNGDEYRRISTYIKNNPQNWENDEFNNQIR